MSAQVLRMYVWTDESGEHVICESCGTMLDLDALGTHIDLHAFSQPHAAGVPLTHGSVVDAATREPSPAAGGQDLNERNPQ